MFFRSKYTFLPLLLSYTIEITVIVQQWFDTLDQRGPVDTGHGSTMRIAITRLHELIILFYYDTIRGL